MNTTRDANDPPRAIRLGLRANLAQFSLLVLVNAFVGAAAGMSLTQIVAGRRLPRGVGRLPARDRGHVGLHRPQRADRGRHVAAGALLSGLVADLFGVASAMWLVAGLTFLSGAIAAARMQETHTTSR